MQTGIETGSPKSRRRRRAAGNEGKYPNEDEKDRIHDYYDDSDDDKDHRSNEAKIRQSACSFGRFALNPCLCLITSASSCYHRLSSTRKKRLPLSVFEKKGSPMKKLVDLALLAAAVLSGLVCVYSFFPQTFSYRYIRRRLHANIRPKTDADVNRVELRIPKLDFKNAHSDIGGWMMFHKFFEATEPVDFGQPDNGGLKFLGNFGRERSFSRDLRIEAEKAEKPVEPKPPNADWLYYEYAESIEDIEQECRRVDWKHLYHPSCNEIHEIDLVFDYKEDVASLGYDQTLDSFYIRYVRFVWPIWAIRLS